MKKLLICVVGLALLAACGGGSGGNEGSSGGNGGSSGGTPTTASTTSANTKVAAGSTVTSANEAVMGSLGDVLPIALGGLSAKALNVKKDYPLGAKTAYQVDTTYDACESGSAAVTGTVNGSCSSAGGSWSCTFTSGTIYVDFSECVVTTTIGDTQYEVTFNSESSGSTGVTASVSGTASGTGAEPTTIDVSGQFSSGTVTVSWTDSGADIEGSVDLTGVEFAASTTTGVDNVSTTCSGTTDVTIGSTEETCTVASTCDTCEK